MVKQSLKNTSDIPVTDKGVISCLEIVPTVINAKFLASSWVHRLVPLDKMK